MSTIPGLIGPSVAALRYGLEALLSSEPWLTDPGVLAIPWRTPLDADSGTKLSFGFVDFDGVVRPHPPITRALTMVKDALQALGHEAFPHCNAFSEQAVRELMFSKGHPLEGALACGSSRNSCEIYLAAGFRRL